MSGDDKGDARQEGQHRDPSDAQFQHPSATGHTWDRVEEDIEEAAERIVDGFESTVDRALPPHVRARLWARRRRATHVVWRAGVLVVGMALLLAGIAMLVLPGPGWGAIVLGLVILASEYAWARRVLDPVTKMAQRAAAAALDPRHRRRNLVVGAGVTIAVGLAVTWYLATFGLSLAPVTDLWGMIATSVR